MGGSAVSIISSVASLAGSALGMSSSRRGGSAADLAKAQAAAAARERAESRRRREEEAQEAAEREKNRLARMRGLSSTLATGGAGLLSGADVDKPGLKARLGE
jgi:hypothetical protein